jgi:hypothetical protein
LPPQPDKKESAIAAESKSAVSCFFFILNPPDNS